VLAQWLSALAYRRTMGVGMPSEQFFITPDRMFIEQPDNVEGFQFPAIGVLPGRGQYLTRGIGGTEPDDESATSEGLALLVPYDYQELITVEVWGSKKSERRAIVAAIEVAMGTYEGTTDLRLIMADYYGLVVTFSLMERENLEETETVRGRRRAHLFLQMTVPVVAEAKFLTLLPGIETDVSGSTGGRVDGLGEAALHGSLGLTGEAGLHAMGLDLYLARQVAKATLGITQLQADRLTVDYLLSLMQSLAAKNSSLETSNGRPPYSPGETQADAVMRDLPRT
jgi:hypothetical protein